MPFRLSDYVLREAFTTAGTRQGWLDAPKIIAAFSGGGDSSALLWMCAKFFGGKVVALHVNHGIRGAESDADEEFSREFAERLGAEFVSVRVDVPASRLKGESLEAAARRLRREALCNAAKRTNISTVLLGHNRDDLAETVLFNLLRGTGIRGAVGITEMTETDGVKFCRPLLGMRREFLREVLRARGLEWREDSTNSDDNYTRNYIRNTLIPTIAEHINSSAVEHLAQFGEDMRQVREAEDERSRELFAATSADASSLDWRKLREMDADSVALVIREAGRRRGLRTLSRAVCTELAGLILKGEGFVFQWCGEVTIQGRKGRITIHDDRGTNSAV